MEREAARLRVALRLSLVSVEEVVRWADDQIAAAEKPSATLLDLSLMRDANPLDVLHQLSELSGGVPFLEVLPAALGAGAERLRGDPSLGPTVARGLYQLYVEANYEVPAELEPIGGFDDEYALARQGTYGSEEDVFRELLAFASRFRHER